MVSPYSAIDEQDFETYVPHLIIILSMNLNAVFVKVNVTLSPRMLTLLNASHQPFLVNLLKVREYTYSLASKLRTF